MVTDLDGLWKPKYNEVIIATILGELEKLNMRLKAAREEEDKALNDFLLLLMIAVKELKVGKNE